MKVLYVNNVTFRLGDLPIQGKGKKVIDQVIYHKDNSKIVLRSVQNDAGVLWFRFRIQYDALNEKQGTFITQLNFTQSHKNWSVVVLDADEKPLNNSNNLVQGFFSGPGPVFGFALDMKQVSTSLTVRIRGLKLVQYEKIN